MSPPSGPGGDVSKVQSRRYKVSYPVLELEGLTANFEKYLQGLGFTPDQKDLIVPQVETVTPEIASLFLGVLPVGESVVHRSRLQGIKNMIPLRIGNIYYPQEIAAPYMDQLLNDTAFDMPAALKVAGIVITREKINIRSYTRSTREERAALSVIRTHPLLEVRRICYDDAGGVVTMHRTIWDGSKVSYTFDRPIDFWK